MRGRSPDTNYGLRDDGMYDNALSHEIKIFMCNLRNSGLKVEITIIKTNSCFISKTI